MKLKFLSILFFLIIISSTASEAASILLPERYDIEVQLDSFMEELMKKLPKNEKKRVYIARFNSPSKSRYYQVLGDNIKSYITTMASFTNIVNIVTSKSANEIMLKLIEENQDRPIEDFQILESLNIDMCDIVIYGYISILDEKLVVDIKTLDLKAKKIILSMYISSNEQTIAAKVGIKNYTPSSFLRHSIGVSFDTTFAAWFLSGYFYELYTIYLNYSYYPIKWGAINVQLGFDIDSKVSSSTYSGGIISSSWYVEKYYYTGANFDLNLYWDFFIPFNEIFIPVISLGIGGSKHTKKFLYSSVPDGVFEIVVEPFLFNLLATIGFDLYFNKNLFLRATADLKYTVNSFIYIHKSMTFVYQKPLFSVTLGFFIRL